MLSATILSMLLVAVSAFATGPGTCVGSSPADIEAAVKGIFSRMTEAEIEEESCPWAVPGVAEPNATLCASFAPTTCAEVFAKGVCENAAEAGLKCCECDNADAMADLENLLEQQEPRGACTSTYQGFNNIGSSTKCPAGHLHHRAGGNICSAQTNAACMTCSSTLKTYGCCDTCDRPCKSSKVEKEHVRDGGCRTDTGSLGRCRSVGRRRRRRGRTNTCQGSCHPAASTVELEGGGFLPMDELAVGMRIRVPDGHAPVLGFLHQERDMVGEYFELTAGKRALAVSSHHYIVANGREVDPSTVTTGDVLYTPEGNVTVTRVQQQKLAAGAFHPFVAGGSYYVDGLLATDYNDHTPKWAWELVRVYVATRYHLGIPVIPEGHGLVKRPFFAFDALDKMGVPSTAQWPLIPLLIPTVLAAELVNLAAEVTLAAAVLAALSLIICRRSRKADKAKCA